MDIAITNWMHADLYFNFFQNRMDWRDGDVYSRLIMPKADLNIDIDEDWRPSTCMMAMIFSSLSNPLDEVGVVGAELDLCAAVPMVWIVTRNEWALRVELDVS